MAQSVKIPVELELKNIQGAISSLKSALSGVSKDSGIYKTLSKELDQIERKYKELGAVASRPFTNVSSINAFEKQFLRLNDRLVDVSRTFNELKFKDLDLKGIPDAEAKFTQLIKKVQDAQAALNSINTDQLKLALGDSTNKLTESLEKVKQLGGADLINPNSFEKTFSAISQKAETVAASIEKTTKEVERFQTISAQAEGKINLFKEVERQLQGITSKADLLKNIAPVAQNAGMTPERLLDLLGLNNPALYEGTAEKIQEKLGKSIASKVTSLTGTALDSSAQANARQRELDDLRKYLDALKNAQAELDSLQKSPGTQSQMESAKAKVAEATSALNAFEQKCRETHATSVNAGNAINLIGQNSGAATGKIESARASLQGMVSAAASLDQLKSRLAYFFSFYKIMGTVRNAVREAVTTIKELDSVMTEISVVTNKTQQDLWNQINTYSAMANEYAVSIKGVYEVSQLYYQQGLQTAEVMNLTEETLKMAKIAGLDYATATDYMTVAVRGFKMEMSEAQRVTDIYSALAAGTASDTEELAVAMSKTASSAEAVGASFESTSAMIATMVSITREAPENIGSALKSIISRYGEMTTNPEKLIDSEGEVMSLNKVDKALQSVGISLQDAQGQFRAFDDVILELAQSWDTIDTNTQRYIATIMAGNRQQSRFLALVGNHEEYANALEMANNAEDASARQVLKTLDSIESKLTNVKTAWQQFYTSLGLENMFKNTLDTITQIINNLNKMNKFEAFTTIFNIFTAIKGLVMGIFSGLAGELGKIKSSANGFLSIFNKPQKIAVSDEEARSKFVSLQEQLTQILSQKLNIDISEAKAKLESLGLKTKDVVQPGTNLTKNLPTNIPLTQALGKNASGLLSSSISASQLNNLILGKNTKTLDNVLAQTFGDGASAAKEALKKYTADYSMNLLGGKHLTGQYKDAERVLQGFVRHLESAGNAVEQELANKLKENIKQGKDNGQIQPAAPKATPAEWIDQHAAGLRVAASALQTAGALLTTAALTMKDSSEKNVEMSKITAGGGTLLSGLGSAVSGALMGASAGLPGIIIGAISAGLPSLISGFSQIFDGLKMSTKERIGLLNEELKEAQEKETVEKGKVLDLENSIREFEKLEKAQFDSAEAAEAFRNHMNTMGEQYPQLIESMDASGNAIIDAQAAEQMLADARLAAAEATIDAAETEYNLKEQERLAAQEARENFDTADITKGTYKVTAKKDADDLNLEGLEDLYGSSLFENLISENSGVFGIVKSYSLTQTGRDTIGSLMDKIAESGTANLTETEQQMSQLLGLFEQNGSLSKKHFGQEYGDTETIDSFISLQDVTLADLEKGFISRESILQDMTTSLQSLGGEYAQMTAGEYFKIDAETPLNKIIEAIDSLDTLIEQRLLAAGDEVLQYSDILEQNIFDKDLKGIASLNVGNEIYDHITEYGPMLSRLGLEMVKNSLNTEDIEAFKAIEGNEDEYQTAHDNALEIIQDSLLGASKSSMAQVVDLFNNFDKIKSSADIESALQEADLYSDELFNALNGVYADYTSAARERIEGAAKNYSISRSKGALKEYFDGLGNIELSTQYIDQLVEAMNLVDNYAEEGLSTKANILNNAVFSLYNSIANLDTDLQNSLFSIVDGINWADATSINQAIEAITSFIEQNPESAGELEATLQALQYARDNLPANIQTEIQGYIDLIRSSFEKTKENVAGMTDGFETSDALSKADQLTSVKGFEDLNFNDLFIFDEQLGKYVYSLKGFEATIAQQKQELAKRQATIKNAIAELEGIDLTSLIKRNRIQKAPTNDLIAKIFAQDLDWEDKVGQILNLEGLEVDERAAVVDAMKGFDPEGDISLEEYLTNYVASIEDEYERATIEAALLGEERIRALKNSLDFSSLGAGSASEGQKNTLIQLLQETAGLASEELAAYYADLILRGGEAGLEALSAYLGDDISYDDKVAYLEGYTENYTSAINKALEEPGTILSKDEAKILRSIDPSLVHMDTNGMLIAQEVENLGTLINDILENTTLTLAQQNELIAQAYEADFSRRNPVAEFGSKSSLSYSDLGRLATIQKQSIEEAILNSVSNGLKQNTFTGEFEIVDFNAYWEAIGGSISNATAEYLDAYSSWVDEQISKNNNFGENVSQSLGDLQDAKAGDQINVVYLTAALKEAGLAAETFLQNYGIAVKDGIATLSENTNIYGLMQDIARLESSGAIELSDSLGELKDSIQEMFESWVSALSAGLAGNLSNADAESLKQQFSFLTDADFTRTKEGLKISQQAAYELYQHLKDIDSISSQLALDALVESTMEAEQGMNDVYQVMDKIADINKELKSVPYGSERYNMLCSELEVAEKIRDTIIDSGNAFNFMDRDLPTSMTNPLSAWEGIGDALKVIDGDQFMKEGYIDFTDLYNMISMMDQAGIDLKDSSLVLKDSALAAMDNVQILEKLVESMSNATVNVDGQPLVDFSQMYADGFVIGADQLRAGVAQGMEEVAQANIDIIDAQIELLEVIVAMEEISEIDIDGDGIELGELFEFKPGETEETADGWEDVVDWTDKTKEVLSNLNEKMTDSEGNLTELGKRFEAFKINNHSLLEIIRSTPQDLQKMGFSLEQSLAIFQAIEKMVESGDYDLETLLSSISQIFNESFSGSGLVLDFGGKTILITPEGASIEVDWEKVNLESINLTKDGAYNLLEKVAKGEKLPPLAGFKYEVLIGNAEVKVDENGETYYTYQGKRLAATTMSAAAQEIALIKQAGLSGTNVETVVDSETQEVTSIRGSMTLGETTFEVTSDSSGVTLKDSETGQTYTGATLQEAKEALIAGKVAEAQAPGGSGETEAQIREKYGVQIELTPDAQVISGLNPVQLQDLASAYLSGDNAGFLQLAMDLKILPSDLGIENGSEVSQEQINALAASLGISSMPIPVNISFSGVTAEEATTLASSIGDLADNCATLNGLTFSSFSSLTSSLQGAFGESSSVIQTIDTILEKLNELDQKEYTIDLIYNVSQTGEGQEQTTTLNVDDAGATSTLTGLATAMLEVNTSAGTMTGGMTTVQNALTTSGDAFAIAASKIAVATNDINRLAGAVSAIPSGNEGRITAVNSAMKEIPMGKGGPVQALARAMNNIPSGTKSITVNVTVKARTTSGPPALTEVKGDTSFRVLSKGNTALAKGTGSALASGRRTLMGELGPELVVSNGRYFTVGNNGAEFVDLPDDAIVFNHLQTKKLLGSGGMVGTGEPITNERKATALAGGNITGPAMASAEQALSELKKLRSMWQGLLDASAADLGKKAGQGLGSGKSPSGGGGGGGKKPGGGGGGGGGKKPGGGGGGGGGGGSGEEDASVLGEFERWYNLLRQIEKLEQKITHEEAKRENMISGFDRNDSLEEELELLKKQRDAYEELSRIQKDFYERRREDLLSTDYSKIFTYDKDGLMQYVDGENRGLDILAKLNETDANGKAKLNAKQQLEYLSSKAVGFDISVLKTNADGTTAKKAEDQMQNFWDGVDGWIEEMDSLYDSYNEAATNMEETTKKMNEILQEQIDNQLTVEEKLMKALEAREQAEIDRIQKEKEALEEAAEEYIDGLNTALEKERSMYEKNETDAETSRLQRQLAILQRSGGSASEIKSLQDQIDSRLKDAYFEEQQSQIDAIQEASDNQLEKLQTQIDILSETLEYQKENGLFWNEVYEMMQTWTPEAMLEFIERFDPNYKTDSATQNQQNSEETLREIEQWVGYNEGVKEKERQKREDQAWASYYDSLTHSQEIKEKHAEGARKAFSEAYGKTENLGAAKQAADDYYAQKIKESTSTESSESNTTTKQEDYPYGKASETTGNIKKGASGQKVKAIQYALNQLGYGNSETESLSGKFGSKTKEAVKKFQKAMGISADGIVGNNTREKFRIKQYKTGGLVDYTGPAWVDGTKTKPEAFLSASDTAMLKSKIFSNSDGSLKSLVAALEAITKDTSKYSAPANTGSIVIQNAQVNIQPGVISNDYDARRAGEMALEEMVKIARKTTNRVVSR